MQYSGRCVCPTGYYKFGFTTTTCNKTEYINETWAKYKPQIKLLSSIDDTFKNYAFTVRQMNQVQPYVDYLTKFSSFSKAFVEDTQFSQLIDIVEMLSKKDNALIAPLIKDNYEQLIDAIISKAGEIGTVNILKYVNRLFTFGETAIQLSNYIAIKQEFFDLMFGKLLGILVKYSTETSAEYGSIKINWVKNFIDVNMHEIGNSGLKIKFPLYVIQKFQATCISGYYLVFNEIGSFNPFDSIQTIESLTEIVQVQLFCISSPIPTKANILLTSSDHFFMQFKSYDIPANTVRLCSYWNEEDLGWENENSYEGDLTNQCYFNQLGFLNIIKDGSQNYICGTRCKNCDGTGCLECNPAYYLIDSVCYARYELTLTQVLKRFSNIYILDLNQQCLSATKTEIKLNDCNSSDIPYLSLQWTVDYQDTQIDSTTIKKLYTFTNAYYPKIVLKVGEINQFEIQAFSNSDLINNQGRLQLYDSNIEPNCLLNTLNSQVCAAELDSNEIWEFLPKKGNLKDPIQVVIDITEQSDVLSIKYLENNPNVTYVISGTYSTNLYFNYKCSSDNIASLVAFNKRENDVSLELSLGDLKQCDFDVVQSSTNQYLYIISGWIIHIFPESNQLFLYKVYISFYSTLTIDDTNVALNTDQSNNMQIVIIQQQSDQSELTTHYVPTVSVEGSESQSEYLEAFDDSLTIQISLPETVESTYELSLLGRAKLSNDFKEYYCGLTTPTDGAKKNTYLIDVDLSNVDSGEYRLKFSCSLSLKTSLRRLRMLDVSESVDLMIDKQVLISGINSTQNTSSETSGVNITDIQLSKIDQNSNSEGVSLVMIIIIVVAGVASLGLIFAFIFYTRNTIQNKKQRELEINSENEKIDQQSIQEDIQEEKAEEEEDSVPQEDNDAESNEIEEEEFVADDIEQKV